MVFNPAITPFAFVWDY